MKIFIYLYFSWFIFCEGRIHKLKITNDQRTYIRFSTFGYYAGGSLTVNVLNFTFASKENNPMFGFTVEKILNDAIDPHLETYQEKCLLKDQLSVIQKNEDVIFFIMDLEKKELQINCSAQSVVQRLQIYEDTKSLPLISADELTDKETEAKSFQRTSCVNRKIPITGNKTEGFQTKFVMYVPTENEEGFYELFFHNCANYRDDLPVESFLSIEIIEYNLDSYISAGEMPLPELYFAMSVIFFISAVFWIRILVKSRHPVYKIHYLMAALVILKSLGLLFHSINYHYISVKGEHVTTWAILYYVIHLLRGSVLFITIILIGTGWTFIKHILSPKDKKIFMIVIPLQVFANVAEIIIDESEEGDAEHKMWLNVFTFVDLLCCFAILFPIVWSIKHLQDASQTDGKAAINLKKLKLFRHFYIMIVCYIYFTRIIVYLLKMTVPFQYEWLDEMFKELATFIFFVLTGYKFRPASENPYFHVAEEEENEIDIIVSKCGFTEGLTKLSKISNDIGDEDKDTLLIYKREIYD